MYQVWWKSTQGFLRFRVNEVKRADLDQVHWPLTLGRSRPKSNQFIYSSWCTPVPSLMKIHLGVLEISRLRAKNSIFRPSSLTFDLGWNLAQNLCSSSTPHGAPLCQVWWKSTQGFLRYRVYEVKIAYLDQVYWPLTLGGSRPKSNQFIYSSWCIPGPSMIKIHQGVLEISCLRDSRTDGRTTQKHNASGALRVGRRHKKIPHPAEKHIHKHRHTCKL